MCHFHNFPRNDRGFLSYFARKAQLSQLLILVPLIDGCKLEIIMSEEDEGDNKKEINWHFIFIDNDTTIDTIYTW